jgi:hypothetical protein
MPRRLTLLGLVLVLASAVLPAQGLRQRTRPAAEADPVSQDRAALSLRMTRAEFASVIRRDRSLHIAPSGAALYICKAPARAAVNTDTTTFVENTPFPEDQTFALNSRPGARRVIYLDFTGHVTRGTDWNDPELPEIVSPVFDLDGNPGAFSPREHAAIQSIWRQVAEDFAPFDVNVTTVDPGEGELAYAGPGDNLWGTRVVFGGSSDDWLGGGAGGVAFLDSFESAVDTPCFVFPDSLGGDTDSMAYAAAHEVGHTFGLSHDGIVGGDEYYDGHANWAPIMGAGYGRAVVQWSQGEYNGANNQEDDLALIARYAPYADRDIALSSATAPELKLGDFAGGIIGRRADTAWYRLELGDGQLNLNGEVAAPGVAANLKLRLALVDDRGATVRETAVGATMGTRLQADVTRGTYYLVVDGIGDGDPSTGFNDYSSLGRFRVSGSWPERPANVLPLAFTAGSTPLLGGRPLTVNFVGTNSIDIDGTIVGYEWNFGDGSPVSNLPSPSHTYATAGTYKASLTVTDDRGGVSPPALVDVVAAPRSVANRPIRVLSMTPSWVAVSRTAGQAQCLVRVVDSGGRPLPGVRVTATLEGLETSVVTAVTDRAGNATLRSASLSTRTRGTLTFRVREATLTGYTYLPTLDKVKSSTVRR